MSFTPKYPQLKQRRRLQGFLALECMLFLTASQVHAGRLVAGYAHARASIAETVIAVVMGLALVASASWPTTTRRSALLAQGFALLGTLVGVAMIAIGIGPRSVPDIVFHAILIGMLVAGLRSAGRGVRDSVEGT